MDYVDTVFRDGAWHRADHRSVHPLVNPATEQQYGAVAESSQADVDKAVASATTALDAGPWASASVEDRIRAVRAIRDWLAAREERLSADISVSMGLPRTWARGLLASMDFIDSCIESAQSLSFEYLRTERTGSTFITRRPVGVVAGITPWNTPIRAEVKKAIPALLAGCTVVLKPAPDTPCGGLALARAAAETGLPPGVLNVVFGGPATGDALVRHPGVSKISFTGSTATGARIAEAASRTFKRLQLELGGKSAAIVLDDADLATAIPVLGRANFFQSGQMCAALSRILVPRGRGSEIAEALAENARSYVLGDPLDAATTMGPLVNRQQYERVLGYLEIGKDEGAKVVTGGTRPAHLPVGYYIEPTVLLGVENSMRIAREEIFGPVASIIEYDDEDDALAIANDTPYGLNAAVMSADETHALEVARRIHSGTANINSFGVATSAPFGGVKLSGIGREHGPEGFDSFLEYRSHGLSEALAAELARRGVPRQHLNT
jgi:aldehyde dehydrogenase (NAD+)